MSTEREAFGSEEPGLRAAERLLLDEREVARLFHHARERFGIGTSDAEDILQDTVLDLLRVRAVIRHPRAYVTRVFHMQCCQYVRRAIRNRARPAGDALPDFAAPEGLLPEDLLALRQALDRISPGCKELLLAHYRDGKRFGEAARDLGFSEKQAWKRFNACLRKLRLSLENGTR